MTERTSMKTFEPSLADHLEPGRTRDDAHEEPARRTTVAASSIRRSALATSLVQFVNKRSCC